MVLDDFAVSNHVALNDSYRNSLKSSVDKRHHPVLIFRKRREEGAIHKLLVCRGSTKEMLINQFQHGKWFININSDAENLEKYHIYTYT